LKVHLKPLTKTGQSRHIDSRKDSNLEIIKFRDGFFIEVIAKDVSFPMNLTLVALGVESGFLHFKKCVMMWFKRK
jgi:hypothetical protein